MLFSFQQVKDQIRVALIPLTPL